MTLGMALLAGSFFGQGRAAEVPSGLTPQTYLTLALNYIQNNALNTARIDWPQTNARAMALATTVKTPAETYPFIRAVIAQLGDHHSSFWAPGESLSTSDSVTQDAGYHSILQSGGVHEVYLVRPGSRAQQAGLAPGDLILERKTLSGGQVQIRWRKPGQSPSQSTVTTLPTSPNTAPQPASAEPLGNGVVRFSLFSNVPANTPQTLSRYAQQAQSVIGSAEKQASCGWVLDLRQDPGGSTAAQMLALGPLLDPAARVTYIPHRDPAEAQFTTYQNGQVSAHSPRLTQPLTLQVTAPVVLSRPVPPLAVLQGPATASAAEGLLVMLRGRPQTRFFGEPSAGVPTGNIGQTLPDGAHITLTEGVTQDRNGKMYDSALTPEVSVPAFKNFGTPADPALQAAQRWLRDVCHS